MTTYDDGINSADVLPADSWGLEHQADFHNSHHHMAVDPRMP
jgi:hypothetical protein